MPTPAERRAQLVERYLAGVGMGAVFVLGSPGGGAPCRVLLVTDLVAAMRAIGAGVAVHARAWFSNAAVATRVYRAALALGSAKIDGTLGTDPQTALTDVVMPAAASVGAVMRGHDEVMAQAFAAVNEVLRQSDALKDKGGLTEVNRGYKQYRKAHKDPDRRPVDYADWLHIHHLRVVERTAARVRLRLRMSID